MAQFRSTADNPKRRMLFKGKPIKKRLTEKQRAIRKAYYEKNRLLISEKRKRHPDKVNINLKYHLKTYYGLSLNEYKTMVEKQYNCCAICLRHESKLKKRLYVDHCHKTKKVRALLCSRCNLILGKAHDCASLLRVAADYLEAHYGSV